MFRFTNEEIEALIEAGSKGLEWIDPAIVEGRQQGKRERRVDSPALQSAQAKLWGNVVGLPDLEKNAIYSITLWVARPFQDRETFPAQVVDHTASALGTLRDVLEGRKGQLKPIQKLYILGVIIDVYMDTLRWNSESKSYISDAELWYCCLAQREYEMLDDVEPVLTLYLPSGSKVAKRVILNLCDLVQGNLIYHEELKEWVERQAEWGYSIDRMEKVELVKAKNRIQTLIETSEQSKKGARRIA